MTAGTRTSVGFPKVASSGGSGIDFQAMTDRVKDLKSFIDTFEFESQELDVEEFKKQFSVIPEENKINVRKYRDAIYVGEIDAESKRQGKGIMIYANGRRYEGYWENDIRHGRGYERHANGNIYIG
jgi:hypothetical protein